MKKISSLVKKTEFFVKLAEGTLDKSAEYRRHLTDARRYLSTARQAMSRCESVIFKFGGTMNIPLMNDDIEAYNEEKIKKVVALYYPKVNEMFAKIREEESSLPGFRDFNTKEASGHASTAFTNLGMARDSATRASENYPREELARAIPAQAPAQAPAREMASSAPKRQYINVEDQKLISNFAVSKAGVRFGLDKFDGIIGPKTQTAISIAKRELKLSPSASIKEVVDKIKLKKSELDSKLKGYMKSRTEKINPSTNIELTPEERLVEFIPE